MKLKMGKYGFQLPDGKSVHVEAQSFSEALMKVCDQVGIKAIGSFEVPETTKLPYNVVGINSKKSKSPVN